MITHITRKELWKEAKRKGVYKPDSLETDGFIHCSDLTQVLEVAEKLFKDEEDLVLICIDEKKLSSDLVYEDLYMSGEKYPHIYGPLDLEAVDSVHELMPDENGTSALPQELEVYNEPGG